MSKGDAFLPGYTLKDLEALYLREKDSKAKIRLLAAIHRKQGLTYTEIGWRIKYSSMTVRDWLHHMHKEGIHRRYNKKKPGRPKKLTDEQLEDLKKNFLSPPQAVCLLFLFWTTKLAQSYIEQVYNVSYSLSQVRNILHSMGMACIKPRPRHRKANKKAQEEFKINFKPKITDFVEKGFKVCNKTPSMRYS